MLKRAKKKKKHTHTQRNSLFFRAFRPAKSALASYLALGVFCRVPLVEALEFLEDLVSPLKVPSSRLLPSKQRLEHSFCLLKIFVLLPCWFYRESNSLLDMFFFFPRGRKRKWKTFIGDFTTHRVASVRLQTAFHSSLCSWLLETGLEVAIFCDTKGLGRAPFRCPPPRFSHVYAAVVLQNKNV